MFIDLPLSSSARHDVSVVKGNSPYKRLDKWLVVSAACPTHCNVELFRQRRLQSRNRSETACRRALSLERGGLVLCNIQRTSIVFHVVDAIRQTIA